MISPNPFECSCANFWICPFVHLSDDSSLTSSAFISAAHHPRQTHHLHQLPRQLPPLPHPSQQHLETALVQTKSTFSSPSNKSAHFSFPDCKENRTLQLQCGNATSTSDHRFLVSQLTRFRVPTSNAM